MGKSAKARLTTGTRILLVMAAACIVIGAVREAKGLLVPFIFAMFLAVVLSAPLAYMRGKGVPRYLSLLILMVGLGGIGFATVTLVGDSARRFKDDQANIETKLEQEKDRFLGWVEKRFGEQAAQGLSVQLDASHVDGSTLMKYFGGALQGLLVGLSQLFLVFIMVIFMLLEASGFLEKLKFISLKGGNAVSNANEITTNVRRYLSIKTVTSGLTGLLIWAFVSFLGLEYGVIFGLLAFLLNYVPNVGSVIASIPAILLALVDSGLELAVICGLGYVFVNCLISYVIEPRFMGRGLGLSVLVVFLSLIFWGWVLGPAGMFLSAPLTMILKIVLQGGEDTRWLAILMGSGKELEPALSAISVSGESTPISQVSATASKANASA